MSVVIDLVQLVEFLVFCCDWLVYVWIGVKVLFDVGDVLWMIVLVWMVVQIVFFVVVGLIVVVGMVLWVVILLFGGVIVDCFDV